MTFTVTYRDRTGAKREEAIAAASRSECVMECRNRGISPLLVQENAKGSKEDLGASKDHRDIHGFYVLKKGDGRGQQFLAVLGTLVLLGILTGGAWWWMAGNKDTPPTKAQNTPTPPRLEKPSPIPEKVSPSATTKPQKDMVELKPQKPVRDPAHYRNAANIGKKRIVHDDGTVEYVGRPTLFKRPFENMLVGITNPNGPAASGIMRLRRRYTDAQIYDMLREPVEIDRTLPDWAVEKQIQIQQFKLDLLDYLEQGKTFDEAVVDIRMNSTAMHQEYATAKKQLRDLIKSDATNKEIMEFILAKNEDLAAKGVKLLALPYFEQEEVTTTKEK